jgi:fermentation-respiration switch protein FrsA (DUF1100 family)
MFCVLTTAACMIFENDMIFIPDKTLRPGFDASRGVEFKAADGTRLHGAFYPVENARGAILWFHGNGGNISYLTGPIADFRTLGVSVFVFDYRGYGNSEGSPSGRGVILDAEAAYAHLTGELQVPGSRIVFLGESLGGAPAIHLAARVPCAGVICQSNFTSISDMALHRFPFLPWLYFCARTDFPNLATMPKIAAPKLFIHSQDDEIVPFSMGEELYAAASEPKRFWGLKGALHNDTFGVDGYVDRIGSFLDEALGPRR